MTNAQRSLVSAVGGSVATVLLLLAGVALFRDGSDDQQPEDSSTTTTTTTPRPTSTTSTTAPSSVTTTSVVAPAIAPPAAAPAPRMPRTAAVVVDNSIAIVDTRIGESTTLVTYPETTYPEPSEYVHSAALAPDGVVYYTLQRYDPAVGSSQAIWRVAEGQEPELVVDGGDGLSLSPDGSRLAYAREESEHRYILVVRDLGSGEEQAWGFADGVESYSLYPEGWSPDGRRLAYQFALDGYESGSVGVLDLRRDSELSSDPVLYGPAWAVSWLDGHTLLYNAGAAGLLFSHDLTTSEDEIIADLRDGLGSAINYTPSVSLDSSGRWLLVLVSVPTVEDYEASFFAVAVGPIGPELTYETLPIAVSHGGTVWR